MSSPPPQYYAPQPGYPPPQGYPPQGYPPQGYPPQGYPAQGYPPPGYPPQQQFVAVAPVYTTSPAPTTIVVSQLSHTSGCVQCPSCGSVVRSSVSYEVGAYALLMAFLIFLFCWPLCWLPCVMDGCKDVVHHCPSCGVTLSRYSRC